MIEYTLAKLAQALSAAHTGADVTVSRIGTDTRKLQPGDVFIALQGPNFDGHDFIAQAAQQGAIAAIVSKDVTAAIPLLKVADTRLALGEIAKLHRQQIDIPYIAITGSCGKTTTKTLTAAIFAQCGNTLATQGTLNNDIGVPLTLLNLTKQHQYAVIELGANHLGEIDYIAAITQPDVAVITNAGPVHLEGFGSLEGVAQGKGEIYQHLKPGGAAVVNADDAFADFWRGIIKQQIITFGLHKPADIRARNIQLNAAQQSSFELVTSHGSTQVSLKLLGEHNIANALAAAAAAYARNIPLAAIKAGLESVQPVDKRLVQKPGFNGAKLIDDTYNANPQAFKMAMQILAQAPGEKVLVIGDMGELGQDAVFYHAEIGRLAREFGIDQLHAVGKLSQHAVAEFGRGGSHYSTQEALIAAVKPLLAANMTVLVKGSRSARMENVVAGLAAEQQLTTG